MKSFHLSLITMSWISWTVMDSAVVLTVPAPFTNPKSLPGHSTYYHVVNKHSLLYFFFLQNAFYWPYIWSSAVLLIFDREHLPDSEFLYSSHDLYCFSCTSSVHLFVTGTCISPWIYRYNGFLGLNTIMRKCLQCICN